MAEFHGHVRVDYCKPTGVKTKTVNLKREVSMRLDWVPQTKRLVLSIEQSFENMIKIPLTPPLQMITSKLNDGELGIVISNCKLTFNSEPMIIQIMISGGIPTTLQKVRDVINVCMARILGKPIKKLPKQVETDEEIEERLLTKKRKADHISGAPSGSEMSTGSRDSNLDAVTSKPSGAQESEDLPELSDEQQRIVDLVKEGSSVFFTGCAGTGKSLVLKHILKSLDPATTYTTASTGIAACHLGGTTLHAFAGIGRASDLTSALNGARSRDARVRWQRATTLIVDEVSMVDAKLFDLVEEVARHVRGSDEPFGGLQLVLSGDFHQLPPVHKHNEGGVRKFCFESSAWKDCNLHCLQLTRVYRQAEDEFVDMLAKIRNGTGASLVRELQERCSEPVDINGIIATKLFTHREDVDAVNASELKALPGEAKQFTAKDTGNEESLRMSCPARRVLDLKVGAQVMLIRNVSQRRGLVNGSRGVVERFVGGKSNPLPVVRFVNGVVTTIGQEKWNIMSGSRTVASRSQIPLELGWGITVHKCQGMTLDAVQINLEKAFEPGMAYVALSRVKTLEGLQIVGNINSRALEAHPKVLAFYKALARIRH